MQKSKPILKIFALALCLCIALSVFMAAAVSLSGLVKTAQNDLNVEQSVAVNGSNWEGKLGLDTGSNKIFDFATQSSTDISGYNGTTRTYNLYAGEVISDVFAVLENRFYWDPLPSSDIMGLFSQFSNTSTMKFKFYARITGKTEGTLKYSLAGAYDTALWGEIKFVFIVRDNNSAHDPFYSPTGADFTNRSYTGTGTSVTFEASKISKNYYGLPAKYRILAGSIAYPGAVDATPLAFYDIGIDIGLNTYTGIGNNVYESMTVGMRYSYYNEFGVEFLVKDIDNGWIGLINCYIASPADKISQGVALKVERRTSMGISNYLTLYNNNSYDFSAGTSTIISSTYTGYNDEGKNNNQHILINPANPNAPAPSGMTYQSKSPIKFDVVVQQVQQMQKYTVSDEFYYCGTHGTEFKGAKDIEHYAPAERAECQVHKGQYGPRGKKHTTYTYAEEVNSVMCYCGVPQWNHCKGYINTYCFHAGTDKPLMNHCRSSTGYAYRYLNMPTYMNGSIKSADCYYEKDVNTAIITTACTYNMLSMAVAGQRYANWNALPYYMAAQQTASSFPQSTGVASFTLTSKTDEIRIGLKNITGATPVTAIPGVSVVADNGTNTYAEIENIYAYDRGYISAGLVRKRNDSYISLIGHRDTVLGMPRYLVLTIVNYQNGIPFRRLVSVDILVQNGETGANAKAIVRTNREPLKIKTELNPTHTSGGNLHFFGVRGDKKIFVADDTNSLSIAYDEDGDSFTFASGTIIYDDVNGTSSAVASTSFSVNVLDPLRPAQIEVTALKVVTGTFYFKVVDSCGGIGYIDIGVVIQNKKPQFSNLPQSITLAPSKFTGGVKVGSEWFLTTKSASTPPASNYTYGVASDGDVIGNTSLDTLTIDVFNWNVTNNAYLSYDFPPADTVSGMPGGRTIRFTAKKWTSGIRITLSVFDGYDTEYVDLTVIVENTKVVPTNIVSNLIFREKAGVQRVFSGNDLGMDFDSDSISIIGNPTTQGQSSDAASLLATNSTNGYISAKIENGELIVTAIAKSVKYDSYFGSGHFGLVVNLKDAGDLNILSTGTQVVIDVTVLNSAPLINDTTVVLSAGVSKIYSATQFAVDNDVKEMAYNIPGKAADKMADRLKFVNIAKKTGEYADFVDFEYLDSQNNVTTDLEKAYSIRVIPKKWTNGTRQVSITLKDESGETSVNSSNVPTTVTFTFSVQNSKPIYRLSGSVGSSAANPFVVNLAVGDSRYPSDYYFYPYSAVNDIDLQSSLYNTSVQAGSVYPTFNPYPAINTPLNISVSDFNSMGKPITQNANMDYLTFDNYNYKVDNNSFGYITIQYNGDTCYRITANQKNTDNPNILLTTSVRDFSGERLTVYVLINVLNSRPVIFDEIIPPSDSGSGHSGIPGHLGVPAFELSVVSQNNEPSFNEWTLDNVVRDNDVYKYGTPSVIGSRIDKLTFQTLTYAGKRPILYENDAQNVQNSAADRIKVTVEAGILNPGSLVLRVQALANTLGSDYNAENNTVWAGFKVSDGFENSEVVWIQIKVLNSVPYQNVDVQQYTYNVTDTATMLPHRIMIRAEDDIVRQARSQSRGINEQGLVSSDATAFSETSLKYPLFVIAKDPDGDSIWLRSVSGVTLKAEGKVDNFIYSSSPVSGTPPGAGIPNWYVVMEFIDGSDGLTTFTANISDPYSQTFTFIFKIMIVNLSLEERYKTISKSEVTVPVTYASQSLGALYSIDLYDLILPQSRDSEFFETGEPHVRFVENNYITSLPNYGDTAYNYSAYTYDGDTGMYKANNTSVFVNSADRKYLQVLGGRVSYIEDDYGIYLQDPSTTEISETAEGYIKAYFKTVAGEYIQAEEGLYIELATGEFYADPLGLYVLNPSDGVYAIPGTPECDYSTYKDEHGYDLPRFSKETYKQRVVKSSSDEVEDAKRYFIKTKAGSEGVEPEYAEIVGVADTYDSLKTRYAYYKNTSGGYDLITNQKLYTRAGNQESDHVRSIWIRGLQRTAEPVEITFAVNIFTDKYVDLDGNGIFEPYKDAFRFKVKFYVSNSSIYDNSSGANKSIDLASITTDISKAVIGTVASAERNSVALSLTDDDRLDTHYISLKSLAVDNSMGLAYSGLSESRNYNNMLVPLSGSGAIPFYWYFNIIDSAGNLILGADASGNFVDNTALFEDSQFIYIQPTRKTKTAAGGRVSLYFMVYDDYLGSSKNLDLFKGTGLDGTVSRVIVCVNISIVNYTPTVTKPNPVTVYASYYPANIAWQTLRLTDYFYDSDMRYVENNGLNYFNIEPLMTIGGEYNYDIIEKITVDPVGDAGNYVTVDAINFRSENFNNQSEYYGTNSQLIRYLVTGYPALNENESSRVRTFNIRFFDGEGENSYVELKLNVYIMNKAPVQTKVNNATFNKMEFYVGQSVMFDTQATTVDYLASVTEGSKGTVKPATDDETPDDMFIREIMYDFTSFQEANKEYFTLIRMDGTSENAKRFQLTAFNATPLDSSGNPTEIEFKFTINDGDKVTELNLTECVYYIKIISRPPEEKTDRFGVKEVDKVITLGLNQVKTFSASDLAVDPDNGDELSICFKPTAYTSDYVPYTRFYNHTARGQYPAVTVPQEFKGNSEYLINGVNTSKTTMLSVQTSENYKSFTITALEVNGDTAVPEFNIINLFIVDRAENGLFITLRVVFVNDMISLKNTDAQSLILSGAGSSTKVQLSNYIKGTGDNLTDVDAASKNNKYAVTVFEKNTKNTDGNYKIAEYTAGGVYQHNRVIDEAAYYEYFDLPESGGIENGRTINFTSKRRTAMGYSVPLIIRISKNVWQYNSTAGTVEKQVVVLEVELNVTVTNVAPVVYYKPVYNEADFLSEDYYLKKDEFVEIPLYGRGTLDYLATDADSDELDFDTVKDVKVASDTIDGDFRKALNIEYDKISGIIKIIVKNKLKNIDESKHGHPYVTRNVIITVNDGNGGTCDVILPITIVNSAPVVILDKFTFSVSKGETYSRLVDGKLEYQIPLSMFIYDGDYDSLEETFTFSGVEIQDVYTESGWDIRNTNASKPERIANVTVSNDSKYFIIKGTSINRGSSSKELFFSVIDGAGQKSGSIRFTFEVGNIAPQPAEVTPVINIMGGDIEKQRVIFLNEADHNLANLNNVNKSKFISLFTDVNPTDIFMLNETQVDVTIANDVEPKVSISTLSAYVPPTELSMRIDMNAVMKKDEILKDLNKKGFIINTLPNIYGQESIFVKAYDSDPTDLSKGALSAVIEIKINIARNPAELETNNIHIFNKRTEEVTPAMVFGEMEAIGMEFLAGSMELVTPDAPEVGHYVYNGAIEITPEEKIKALKVGSERVLVIIAIGEDQITIVFDVTVDINYKPKEKLTKIIVTEEMIITKDKRYGDIGYYRFSINSIVEDREGDELTLISVTSNKTAIVDTRIPPFRVNTIDLLTKASGKAILTIVIKDATGRHTYTFDYENASLPKLSPVQYLFADVAAFTSRYIMWTSIVLGVILVTVITITTIIRRKRMHLDIANLLQYESELDEQMVRITEGYDFNAGYLKEARDNYNAITGAERGDAGYLDAGISDTVTETGMIESERYAANNLYLGTQAEPVFAADPTPVEDVQIASDTMDYGRQEYEIDLDNMFKKIMDEHAPVETSDALDKLLQEKLKVDDEFDRTNAIETETLDSMLDNLFAQPDDQSVQPVENTEFSSEIVKDVYAEAAENTEQPLIDGDDLDNEIFKKLLELENDENNNQQF